MREPERLGNLSATCRVFAVSLQAVSIVGRSIGSAGAVCARADQQRATRGDVAAESASTGRELAGWSSVDVVPSMLYEWAAAVLTGRSVGRIHGTFGLYGMPQIGRRCAGTPVAPVLTGSESTGSDT